MSVIAALRRLLGNASGVAMTEFALGAPVLMLAGVYGVEQANFVLVNMKIGQLAVHIADNASRIGDTSQLKNRKIYESDINDVIIGAQIQAGKAVNVYKHGRVFISSLEVDAASGNQYIHWQRCRGAKAVNSNYGDEGDGKAGTLTGMGPAGAEITAEPGDAVIFVEISYTYQPLITGSIVANKEIRSIAAFNVRDSRDLTQIYQRDALKPDPVQACGAHKGEVILDAGGAMN
ncbi:MAG: hypothetical protein HOO94_03840 [Novosphingobium sp.]|nr:hypothetical protein [Novosphingobium sp.]